MRNPSLLIAMQNSTTTVEEFGYFLQNRAYSYHIIQQTQQLQFLNQRSWKIIIITIITILSLPWKLHKNLHTDVSISFIHSCQKLETTRMFFSRWIDNCGTPDNRWRRKWQPTPILFPGKSHGQRSLVGYSPWGREELDTTERLHFQFSLSCIGEGNGNPLQCCCLENPRDRGTWWAAVYEVAQSRTRLKRLSSSRQ